MERILTENMVESYYLWLNAEEKSKNTIKKYIHDVLAFVGFLKGTAVTKKMVIEYKKHLLADGYTIRSVNSTLAALNSLFAYLGWSDCRVKFMKLQRQIYCPEEKELTYGEYVRLVHAAVRQGNERLALILQTICATGIRISELSFITVKAVKQGKAVVLLKGKTRSVFLVRQLQKKLLYYMMKNKRKEGAIFVTRTGRPMDRTNIWREMKKICAEANVNAKKVFPHNLRHLFARTFYKQDKDIAKLADLLGHSSIETTRIYMVSSGAEHRQCMENMHLII